MGYSVYELNSLLLICVVAFNNKVFEVESVAAFAKGTARAIRISYGQGYAASIAKYSEEEVNRSLQTTSLILPNLLLLATFMRMVFLRVMPLAVLGRWATVVQF